jgi:D-glycero-alpha-D-manno-heptose-7-phosphate kinase
MILSRAPMRITLGGGGTDLPSYYSKKGGFLIAGAIDKYCNITAHRRFYNSIRLSYSETEIVNDISNIKHRIFRTALEMIGITHGIELHSAADVPSGCGLGSSSSFTVALLHALHVYNKDYTTQKKLAEEACHIEMVLMGEPIGKQDQYMAALGGLTCLTFEKDGTVISEPLHISADDEDELEDHLLMFFTGKERSASDILCDQDKKSKDDDPSIIENLNQIKDIGLQTRKYLEAGKLSMLGELMNSHWELKKKRSGKISDPHIDECYELARKNGAIGGKLIGAGGGGFLLFYCENGCKKRIIQQMESAGLKWEKFHFDFDGTKILANTSTRYR